MDNMDIENHLQQDALLLLTLILLKKALILNIKKEVGRLWD
jgi:hypothetical protein